MVKGKNRKIPLSAKFWKIPVAGLSGTRDTPAAETHQ